MWRRWFDSSNKCHRFAVASSIQVSLNARKRAQCKGRGGNNKMMWGTVCNKQLKLSGNTVGCYNAEIVLSNIRYGIKSSCFCNTRLYTEILGKICRSMSRIHSSHCGTSTRGAMAWYLRDWNPPVDQWSQANGLLTGHRRPWFNAGTSLHTFANLFVKCWVRRAPAWKPLPTYPFRGRPPQLWDILTNVSAQHATNSRVCDSL